MTVPTRSPEAISHGRLRNQRITGAALREPEHVVAWLGAVQAQEFEPALWALGLRLRDGVRAQAVRAAFDEGRILRTHVMRPTWHFVARDDIRWMQALTAPRVQRIAASYNRRLELDAQTLSRALRVFERVLRDGRHLTRAELANCLRDANLQLTGQRLAHVAMHAELEAVICSGPRRGRHFTYALVAERARGAEIVPRDEALSRLARRFFGSHGPATLRDFAWWSGLTIADAKRGVEMNPARREEVEGLVYWTIGSPPRARAAEALAHLLPIYDEYLIAYRDRAAVPHRVSGVEPGRGIFTFQHALVIDGQVAGTWRLTRAPACRATPVPARALSRFERRAVADAVRRFEVFAQ